MRVVRMYSGNMSGSQDWKKVEVEVDESDLASILSEAEIDIDRVDVTTRMAFLLLTYEAEILLQLSLVQAYNIASEDVQEEVSSLRGKKNDVLSAVRRLAEMSAADEG